MHAVISGNNPAFTIPNLHNLDRLSKCEKKERKCLVEFHSCHLFWWEFVLTTLTKNSKYYKNKS